MRRIAFILFLFYNSISWAQDITSDTLKARHILNNLAEDPQTTGQQLNQVLKLYQQHHLWEDFFRTRLIRLSYEDEGKTIEQKLASRIALIKAMRKQLEPSNKVLLQARKSLGHTYELMGDFNKAIDEWQAINKVLVNDTTPHLKDRVDVNLNLVGSYQRLGDNKRMMEYLNAAEQLAAQVGKRSLEYAAVLRNKAYISMLLGDKNGLEYIDEALDIVKKTMGTDNPTAFRFIMIKAFVLHNGERESDRAIALYKQLLQKQLNYYKEENFQIAQSYQNIATFCKDWHAKKNMSKDVWFSKKREYFQDAVDNFLQAARIYKKLGTAGTALSHLYRNMGYLYMYRKNAFDQSLGYFHKAQMALLPTVQEDDSTKLVKIANTDLVCQDLILAIRALRGKVNVLRRKYEYTKEARTQILPMLKEMDAIMDQYTRNIADDALQQAFAYRYQFITTFSFVCYSSLHPQDRKDMEVLSFIHQILGKSKNVQLRNALQSADKKVGNVAPEVLQKEEQLKADIADTQKKWFDAIQNKKTKQVQEFQKDLLTLRTAYDDFLQQLAIDYPAYHQLKYTTELPSLSDVQSALDQETVIIEYLLTKRFYYVLVIAQDTVKLKKMKLNPEKNGLKAAGKLRDRLQQMREALTEVQLLKSNPQLVYQNYTQSAYSMYQLLMIDSCLFREGIKHLVIVPSRKLYHIPFEALLASPADTSLQEDSYKHLDYLAKHHSISYAYSSCLWYETMQNSPIGNGQMLGFAASYEESDKWANIDRTDKIKKLRRQLVDLPGARREVQQLSENLQGQFYFGEAANEITFKQEAPNGFSVIHLAMHGLLNEEHPFASSLAFTENGDTKEDHFVFAYELTQMPLNTDLVVLSACETGYGKFQQGEGVASIARSFMYAGVPSIVMTLWEVNDNSTARIMQLFYQKLYEGENKAQALQAAKKEYIEKSKGIAAHPFFWAPFIQFGNTQPLQLANPNQWMYWTLGGAFVLLLIGFLYWRQARQ